jgi:hypothetical protein
VNKTNTDPYVMNLNIYVSENLAANLSNIDTKNFIIKIEKLE